MSRTCPLPVSVFVNPFQQLAHCYFNALYIAFNATLQMMSSFSDNYCRVLQRIIEHFSTDQMIQELGRIKQMNLTHFKLCQSASNRHCSTTGWNICRDSSGSITAACKCIVVCVRCGCGRCCEVWSGCNAVLDWPTSQVGPPLLICDWLRLPILYWERRKALQILGVAFQVLDRG